MSLKPPSQPSAQDRPQDGDPWTVLQLITWSSSYLAAKGVGSPRLDSEHLLAFVLGMDRLGLYLEFDRPVTIEELSRFKPLLLDRARRKPLQYILGRTAFRGLDLVIDPRVLIPRPETEELVDAVLQQLRTWGTDDYLCALDVGTGSGAIALALAQEGPFDHVLATDASEKALEVAGENARTHGLEDRVKLRQGVSLGIIRPGERFHVLVSNPPYVAEEEFSELQPEVRDWEPRGALVAGNRGFSVLIDLVDGAPDVLEVGGLLALEVGCEQAAVVAGRVRGIEGFEAPVILRDLSRAERVVLATWRGGTPSCSASTTSIGSRESLATTVPA